MRRLCGLLIIFLMVALPRAVKILHEDRDLLSAALFSSEPPPIHYGSPDPLAGFRDHPLTFLSTAPTDSLQLLPGIGPVLAARIAEARSGKSAFITWEELLHVRGIGPATVARLQALSEGSR